MTVFLRKTAGFFGKNGIFTPWQDDRKWQSLEGRSGGGLTGRAGVGGRAVFRMSGFTVRKNWQEKTQVFDPRLTSVRGFSASKKPEDFSAPPRSLTCRRSAGISRCLDQNFAILSFNKTGISLYGTKKIQND
jgi:hypothetical protein